MTVPSYETSDKYLGSFLLSQGVPLASWARVSKRRVVFRFEANERLHDLLRFYHAQTPLPLVPLRLTAALRRLKTLARACPLLSAPVVFPPPETGSSPEAGGEPAPADLPPPSDATPV